MAHHGFTKSVFQHLGPGQSLGRRAQCRRDFLCLAFISVADQRLAGVDFFLDPANARRQHCGQRQIRVHIGARHTAFDPNCRAAVAAQTERRSAVINRPYLARGRKATFLKPFIAVLIGREKPRDIIDICQQPAKEMACKFGHSQFGIGIVKG